MTTATTATLPLHINADADVRFELRIALHRLHDDHDNGTVNTAGVIERLADWRPNLTAPELLDLWAHITTAIDRLEQIHSDMWDPAEGDRDQAEQDWTTSLDEGIDRLTGAA